MLRTDVDSADAWPDASELDLKLRKDGIMTLAITTENAPEPRGPYPHVRIDGDHLWVTGQIGRDPASGEFVEGGFEPEFHQAISNLKAILSEAGSSLSEVVHTTIQFVNEEDLDSMNRIYGERFSVPYPARNSYGVAFLWKGAQVQIDAVARLSG